ncbi:putative S-adenosylmethionine-dependent methyltransferase/MSMEI_2290 [Defluviimonas aquaemixtae]|uniref:Putative S-adenosylmethionine-dependent methyltransferase/MSMEI_2290 n=1 Tax=Albidovulum aquaemixtae TaxID=1542388 RepID=A0A2R8B337_9RHOB|nr:class I SAM-dependent methyltransferase [Defluviimonas aquaemixtae]SPH17044.1 putative S-adenosylmethionine-dependent methyltransferase/MSMEI_2290 [Defluviimonas aquaemixtae]
MTNASFWDRIAPKYATHPIKDTTAYEHTLDRTRSYLHEDDRILEIGCGTGSTALLLAENVAHVTASDYAEGMVAIGRQKARDQAVGNIDFVRASLEDGALPDGPYDAVMAFNLLHLLRDPGDAARNVYGLLKPGGLFISKTPCLCGIFRALWLPGTVMRALGKWPGIRFFNPAWLERTIAAQGFEIVESGDFPKTPPRRYIVARKR